MVYSLDVLNNNISLTNNRIIDGLLSVNTCAIFGGTNIGNRCLHQFCTYLICVSNIIHIVLLLEKGWRVYPAEEN